MKQMRLVLSAMLLVVCFAGAATAVESSVAQGEKLFNDQKLGGATSGTSCGSCHAGGKGMEKAGKLAGRAKMINGCIVGKMKGQKINGRTAEMRSLKKYIESLVK